MPIAGLDNKIEAYGHYEECGPSNMFSNGFEQIPNRLLQRVLGEDKTYNWFNVFDPSLLLADPSVTTQKVWFDPVHVGDANFPEGYGYAAVNQLPVVNLADNDFSGMPSVTFGAGTGSGPSGVSRITMREPFGVASVPPTSFTIVVPFKYVRSLVNGTIQALAVIDFGGTPRLQFDLHRLDNNFDRLRFWTDLVLAPGSSNIINISPPADGTPHVAAVKFALGTLTSTIYFDGVPLQSFVHSHAPISTTGQLFGFGNLPSGLAPGPKLAGHVRSATALLDVTVERLSRSLINMMTF